MARAENDAYSMQLQQLRDSTSHELARLGREAALVSSLQDELATLRAELLQADAAAGAGPEVGKLTIVLGRLQRAGRTKSIADADDACARTTP